MRVAFVNLSLKFGSLLKPTKGLSLKMVHSPGYLL